MSTNRIYLIDDEDAVRRSLKLLLRTTGWQAELFDSGVAFLDAVSELERACILLDVRMPGVDGLEVQQQLIKRGIDMPIIVMTGHGDIAVAVAALQAGAVDFVEKPFERARLVTALDYARLKLAHPEQYAELRQTAANAIAELSDLDRSVLSAFAQGLSNQAVAGALSTSVSEIEISRARIVERLGGQNLADAIRTAYLAEAPNYPT